MYFFIGVRTSFLQCKLEADLMCLMLLVHGRSPDNRVTIWLHDLFFLRSVDLFFGIGYFDK